MMKKYGLFLLICLLPLTAFAQLVPLELDQAITLPDASNIWDVMPHPNGYYLWVQAVTHDTTQTRIFWGRTDSAGMDSFDLNVGFPTAIMCFWQDGYDPHILLASRTLFLGWDGFLSDSTMFSICRLADRLPSQRYWLWPSSPYGHHENSVCYTDYRLATAIPNPPPPGISAHLAVAITYDAWWNDTGPHGPSNTTFTNEMKIVADALADTSVVWVVGSYARYASWGIHQGTGFLGLSGSMTHAIAYYGGGGTITYGGMLRILRLDSTGPLQRAIYSHGCDSNHQVDCDSYQPCVSYDAVRSLAAAACRIGNTVYAVNSSLDSGYVWSTTNSYSFQLAGEVVAGNGAEEFLCYDATRHVFDVLSATDGHNYGITDTISIPSNGGACIIGRYDSTSRRLIFRDGNQLKLYRFGEYLAADRNFIPHPSSFSISAYPNPFNPTTVLSFDVPRSSRVQLNVYDLTGRLVQTLADQVYPQGTYCVNFNGSSLSSGIYFVRLQAAQFSKTQKLILLK